MSSKPQRYDIQELFDKENSVCAVHGLNGNAFDTWVASTNQKMWLRDLLPHVSPFDKARVMTFGYSSQLSDSANLSGLSEWAHHLLFSVSSVRQSHQVWNFITVQGSTLALYL